MDEQSHFLDIAHQIGQHLARQALWEEDVCTWKVMTPDYEHPDDHRAVPEITSGLMYQGTAGIALFLSELYHHTYDQEVKEAADGAIQYALSDAQKLSEQSFGFYSGRVGVAYAATKVGLYFDRPHYMKQANDLLIPLEGNEEQDQGLDVIAGAAGAIPALLQLTTYLESDLPARLAVGLGESLIQKAFHEPVGWSWGTLTPSSIRHVNGYGHGASGMGHAFLELYHTTDAERYHYAAEQAFLYERQFFNEETSNWPDFRYSELSKYVRKGRDELQTAIRENELPPPKKTYMSAWCHGAPGIGLARLRALELLGHEIYLDEVNAALEATEASLDPSWNFSLCHGIGGNCETLLYAASVLDEPSLRRQAETFGEHGKAYVKEDVGSWPCGTVNRAPDPSLMLGKAGIGYFYLRLFSAETPSCLFLCAPDMLDLSVPEPTGYRDLQRDYVSTYFQPTLQVLEAYGVESPPAPERPIKESLHNSDVQSFKARLETWLSSGDEHMQTMLEDASRLDRIRFEMQQDIDDFTEELIESLQRPASENISWETTSFELSPFTQIVERQWAWEDWLATAAPERPSLPNEDRSVYLLYRSNNRIRVREIGPFAELVLRALSSPSSLSHLTQTIQEKADPNGIPKDVLQQKIIEQLTEAYEVGAIRILQPSDVAD